MVLRDYHRKDLKRLHEIDNACFTRGIAFTRSELESLIAAPNAFVIIAEEGNEPSIAGFILTHILQRKIGHLVTLDVLPQYRNRGIGSRLLAAAEERLRGQGVRVVYLESAVDNQPAIHLYQTRGYQILDRIPGYYKGRLDAYLMASRIRPERKGR